MTFLMNSVENRDSQAALDARPFWTNGSEVCWGRLSGVSLNGTPSRLGGESNDQIGWGRLRSSACAGRFGSHSVLNVRRAVACAQELPHFHGTHCGIHDDPHDNHVVRTLSCIAGCIYPDFKLQVSGNRISRHMLSQVSSPYAA